MFRRPLVSLLLPITVSLLVCGCAVDRMRLPQFDAAFESGNYQGARRIAAEQVSGSQPHRALLWQLQEATIDRMLGQYQASNAGFDRCEQAFKYYELENLGIAGGKTAVTVLSNDSLRPYSGEQYDRIMVNVYKALNFAALGDHENARVEFNRALQRQVRAKERFAAEIARNEREVTREEASQGTSPGSTERTMESPQTQAILSREYSNLDRFQAYPDFVNPFATYTAGLYFLLRGDCDKALDILKEAHGMLPDNPIVADDFASADANRRVLGKVYVLFENGVVPARNEVRLDLPLFIVTNRVRYMGIALPTLAPRPRAFPYLDIVSNGATGRTIPLASMDAVVAAEFKKDLPMVVSRAVASAIAKAALQYVAQRQMGDLAGILAAGYSAISTAADQRIWSSLPKEFQVGVTTMPTNGQLVLRRPGSSEIIVPLPSCANAIVSVRIPRADALPTVQIIAFN
jgi:hypothetical protein